MNKKTVIVSGGMIEKEFALSVLQSENVEYIIGVDRGIEFLYENEIMPDYLVGDFDSAKGEALAYYQGKNIPVRQFNPHKDATDTELAIQLCIKLGRKNILILGATGNRMDHTWANIQSLKIALDSEVDARIIDSHNQIRLLKGDFILKKSEAFGAYFSVFPLGMTVIDFSIKGAKYPLTHHMLTPHNSLCVSNEIVEEQVEISFPYGEVILMETRD